MEKSRSQERIVNTIENLIVGKDIRTISRGNLFNKKDERVHKLEFKEEGIYLLTTAKEEFTATIFNKLSKEYRIGGNDYLLKVKDNIVKGFIANAERRPEKEIYSDERGWAGGYSGEKDVAKDFDEDEQTVRMFDTINIIGKNLEDLTAGTKFNEEGENFYKKIRINKDTYEITTKKIAYLTDNKPVYIETKYEITLENNRIVGVLLDPSKPRLFKSIKSINEIKSMNNKQQSLTEFVQNLSDSNPYKKEIMKAIHNKNP